MNFLRLAYIGYDWLTTGLVKVLIIIAVLQLVKKIPDVINSIFGTNIKDAGGLKGRLSSMVGGGLALKALSTLGNIGKLALQAPIAGAYVAADAIYHKKNGDRLRNNEIFKKVKGGALAARTAIKTGSLAEAVTTYDQAQAVQALSQKDAQQVVSQVSAKTQGPFRGTTYNNRKDNGEFKDTADHRRDWQSLSEKMREDGLTSEQAELIESKSKSNRFLSSLNGMDKAIDKLYGNGKSGAPQGVVYALNARIQGNSAYSQETQTRLAGILSHSAGDLRMSQENADFLKSLMSVDEAKVFEQNYQKLDKNAQSIKDNYGDPNSEEYSPLVTDENLWNPTKFNDLKSEIEGRVKYREEEMQKIQDNPNVSQATKIKMTTWDDRFSQIDATEWGAIQNDPNGHMTGETSWATGDWYKTGNASNTHTSNTIVGLSGNPIQYSDGGGTAAGTPAPTVPSQAEIDNRREQEYRAQLDALESKSNLSPEEQDGIEELRNDLRKIDERRRNGYPDE